MTRQRYTFTDVVQILQQWVADAEGTVRRSASREHFEDVAMQANARELERNLPKAKAALRELARKVL
jgi:hypothetical protein